MYLVDFSTENRDLSGQFDCEQRNRTHGARQSFGQVRKPTSATLPSQLFSGLDGRVLDSGLSRAFDDKDDDDERPEMGRLRTGRFRAVGAQTDVAQLLVGGRS